MMLLRMRLRLRLRRPQEEEDLAEKRRQEVPIHGNAETLNMNPLLYNNITATDYCMALAQLTTFNECVDEIYNKVCTRCARSDEDARRGRRGRGGAALNVCCLRGPLASSERSSTRVRDVVPHAASQLRDA